LRANRLPVSEFNPAGSIQPTINGCSVPSLDLAQHSLRVAAFLKATASSAPLPIRRFLHAAALAPTPLRTVAGYAVRRHRSKSWLNKSWREFAATRGLTLHLRDQLDLIVASRALYLRMHALSWKHVRAYVGVSRSSIDRTARRIVGISIATAMLRHDDLQLLRLAWRRTKPVVAQAHNVAPGASFCV
jgi:hypothetical protein